jgi:hypothetical protein
MSDRSSQIEAMYAEAIHKAKQEGYDAVVNCPPSCRNPDWSINFEKFCKVFGLSRNLVEDDGTCRILIKGPKGSKPEPESNYRGWI